MIRRMVSIPTGKSFKKKDTTRSANLSKNMDTNITMLKKSFKNAQDFIIREFTIGETQKAAVVFLESMASKEKIAETIIEPLMIWARPEFSSGNSKNRDLDYIMQNLFYTERTTKVFAYKEIINYILRGSCVLLVDGFSSAIAVSTKGWPSRGVQEPAVEVTVRGPRLSFTEVIKDNISLVRTRLRNSNLAMERMFLGRTSYTEIRLMYLTDIAPRELVDEVRRRLKSVDIDMVLDSGQIQKLITDHPYSLFATIRATERPDTVAADLNEGRVAILVDNTPFALIMPSTFFMFFASPEDHYIGFPVATVLRLIRFSGFLISTFISPLYVGLTTFHQELIPLPLLLNIAATQVGTPFPIAITAIAAEILVEVLREAGVRLPKSFGPTVSIVGALVLGQAAIQAGFISPGLVIVVTAGTIASFVVPRTDGIISFRLLRFPLILLGAALGLFGIGLGSVLIIYHIASIKSFGIPFVTLYSPGRISELTEKLVLVPSQFAKKTRPAGYVNRIRRGPPPKVKDPKAGIPSRERTK